MALNGLGWHLCQLGDHEQALVLSRKAGERSIESATLDSLGYAHHHLGQHSEAIACYQQAPTSAVERWNGTAWKITSQRIRDLGAGWTVAAIAATTARSIWAVGCTVFDYP